MTLEAPATNLAQAASAPAPASFRALLAPALCIGLALRLFIMLPFGLWEDEIIAVTHAVQPLGDVVIDTLRNDVHPPLYFLQLHVWGLVSHADAWFVANSVFWSLVALPSLWWVMHRDGRLLAWTATAALAVLPAGVWMSQEVRPYAWLTVLLIWAYQMMRDSFAEPGARRWHHCILLALCLAITWSHAVGFLAVGFNGLYALGLLLRRRAERRDIVAWVATYGLAALCSMPVLAISLGHDANIGDSVSASEIFDYGTKMVTVGGLAGWVWWVGLLTYGGVVGVGLAAARTRMMTACFLVAPLVVALGVGLGFRPIFKANVFPTMLAPFLAIVLAELCVPLAPRLRTPVAAGGLIVLLAVSAMVWSHRNGFTDFRSAVADIRAGMRPGDVIYAPQWSMFCGIAWYLAGPDWGSPLAVANPPSPAWQGVYRRLGPSVVERLHLMPTTQTVALAGGETLMIGADQLGTAARAGRVWLVTYPRADLPSGLPPERLGRLQRGLQRRYGGLEVSLYQ